MTTKFLFAALLTGTLAAGTAAPASAYSDPGAYAAAYEAYLVAYTKKKSSRYYRYTRRYRPYDANAYRYGSGGWWQQMDREGRGGRR